LKHKDFTAYIPHTHHDNVIILCYYPINRAI